MNSASATVPEVRLDCGALRRTGADVALVAALVLWMLYSVNGFRSPAAPIVLSDADSGGAIRQLLFTAAGLLAVRRILVTGSASFFAGLRMPELTLALALLGSCAWSTQPTLTVKRSIVFAFGMLALSVATQMSARPVRLMQRTVTWFTGAVAWLSLALHALLPAACTVNPGRPGLAGISNHPNTLAPFLVIGLVVSLGLTERGGARGALLVCRAGQLVALALTGSMSSIVMGLVSLAVYAYLVMGPMRRGAVQLALAAGALLAAAAGFRTLVQGALGAVGRDASLSGRDELWARVFDEVLRRPWFGHGYGGFWYEGRGRELVATWNPRQAHNAYLDVLADLGLVGLVVVLLAFPCRLWLSWRRERGPLGSEQRRAVAALAATAVGVMTAYALAQSFYFKMDSFPFFALFWCVALLSNRDTNHVGAEFESSGSAARAAG